MVSNKHILLGTIGYHLLSNHSIGPLLYEKLVSLDWTQNMDVLEMNWGPIAIVQRFQTSETHYDRVVFFTAIEREGRAIGDYTIYQWGGRLPSGEDIQACIGDAVTGVISAENLLIIGEHFDIWPDEVYIFDVEPGPENPGIVLSVEVGEQVTQYLEALEDLCLNGLKEKDKVNILYGDVIMELNKISKKGNLNL